MYNIAVLKSRKNLRKKKIIIKNFYHKNKYFFFNKKINNNLYLNNSLKNFLIDIF